MWRVAGGLGVFWILYIYFFHWCVMDGMHVWRIFRQTKKQKRENVRKRERERMTKGQNSDLCMDNEDLIYNVDSDASIGNDPNSIFYAYSSILAILMMAKLDFLRRCKPNCWCLKWFWLGISIRICQMYRFDVGA